MKDKRQISILLKDKNEIIASATEDFKNVSVPEDNASLPHPQNK
jgi:hypothetical protein